MKTVSYDFQDYRKVLEGAVPKLKVLVLDRAANDPEFVLTQLKDLVDIAYPEA